MSHGEQGYWAIAYHTNSQGPRAKKWYYIARVCKVDGKWWCIGRHDGLIGNNRDELRFAASQAGLEAKHGTFRDAPSPCRGPQMIWSADEKAETGTTKMEKCAQREAEDLVCGLLGEFKYLLATGDTRDAERSSISLRERAAQYLGYADYADYEQKTDEDNS